MENDPIKALRAYAKAPAFTPEFCEELLRATLIQGTAFYRVNPDGKAELVSMSDPSNEDTSQLDREMIAKDLEQVAKTAGRLGYNDMATEIGALVAKYRKQPEQGE